MMESISKERVSAWRTVKKFVTIFFGICALCKDSRKFEEMRECECECENEEIVPFL